MPRQAARKTANKKAPKKPVRKTATTRSVRGALRCPECGFQAAHAMGLGRHRTAIHGALSKREAAGKSKASTRGGQRDPRFDRFLTGLEKLIAQARKG